MKDPLCFAWLQPEASASFFNAASELADHTRLHQIRSDLPIYLFSGSEDPVGQQLEGVRVLIKRYRSAGIRDISYDFYRGGRHEMLAEINVGEVQSNLLEWISAVLDKALPTRSNNKAYCKALFV
jgi:alpha-beta hydrolase superfamily lysophospholipase